MKRKLCVLALAAAMLLGWSAPSSAVDFKVKGTWQFGAGVNNRYLSMKDTQGRKHSADTFNARQRIREQIDFIASESLSGSIWFEIGHANYGQNSAGMALGGDGTTVKVRNAYLDWTVPNTDLKFRMGLQNIWLPSAAGGGMVMDNTDVAAVTASYQFNENVGLTAMWARPSNDNFPGVDTGDRENYRANYQDNIDLFFLSVPVKFDGLQVTPWAMYGMQGKNAWADGEGDARSWWRDINAFYPLGTDPFGHSSAAFARQGTGKAYGSMFWAGLPIKLTALDPWNIEVDMNYGWVEAMGRYGITKRGVANGELASTLRQGFIVKALVEYKLDWGIPGVFGWYGSGDDESLTNGSERMPSISPYGLFTGMLGDDTIYDGTMGTWDMALSYGGTWGIGFRLKDMSFVEDLSHTFRVAYRGGTNSPSMVKYAHTALDWTNPQSNIDGPYLTTNDGLLEFNLQTKYDIYENLTAGVELGYIVNMMDHDTWSRSWTRSADATFSRQDAWKANVVMIYKF